MEVLGDKYAKYRDINATKLYKNEENGILVGIGITVEQDESGYMVINEVKPDSPAEQAGLLVGQQIVSVNGQSIITLGYEKSFDELLGDVGTNLTLTIRTDGTDKDVVLTRAEIKIASVTSKMIGDIGYIV